MVRAAIVSALLVAASAACSLFTDFGGIAGQDDDAPPNGGDASGNLCPPEARPLDVRRDSAAKNSRAVEPAAT